MTPQQQFEQQLRAWAVRRQVNVLSAQGYVYQPGPDGRPIRYRMQFNTPATSVKDRRLGGRQRVRQRKADQRISRPLPVAQ